MTEDTGSEEEPDQYFKRVNQPKKPKTSQTREDLARDLPNKALKELDKTCYVSTGHVLDFVHACDLVSLSRDAVDEDGKKTGKKVKEQAKKLFPDATDEESTIELQYPASLTRERYVLIDTFHALRHDTNTYQTDSIWWMKRTNLMW